jgi:hypothetical protein
MSMTTEEFWKNADFDPVQFVYGKPLVSKLTLSKLGWPMKNARMVLSCMPIWVDTY